MFIFYSPTVEWGPDLREQVSSWMLLIWVTTCKILVLKQVELTMMGMVYLQAGFPYLFVIGHPEASSEERWIRHFHRQQTVGLIPNGDSWKWSWGFLLSMSEAGHGSQWVIRVMYKNGWFGRTLIEISRKDFGCISAKCRSSAHFARVPLNFLFSIVSA